MMNCYKNIIRSRIKPAIVFYKKIGSTSVESEKYVRTKIKSYEGKINTVFHKAKHQKKVLIVFVYQWY